MSTAQSNVYNYMRGVMYRPLIFWTIVVSRSTAFMHDPQQTNQTDGSIATWDCPLKCNCSGYDVICSDTAFPDNLPHETRTFHLVDSVIPDIYADALKDLHNLDTINISSTKIGTIRACSFAELENMTSIIFQYVTIGIVEGNAFSNMKNISDISFSHCDIDVLKSYSFHNLQDVGAINMHEVNISTVNRYAFLNLERLSRIVFSTMRIKTLLVDAVSRVTKMDEFFISNSSINEWQCGTLTSVLGGGAEVHVTENTFSCNCKLSWLLSVTGNFAISRSKYGNLCGDRRQLSDLSPNDLCPDESARHSGCPRLLPSTPHTCARKFDTPFDPEEKVNYPSYFTKRPAGNSACLHTPSMFMVMIFLIPFLEYYHAHL